MAKAVLALVGAETLLGREIAEVATEFRVRGMDSSVGDEGVGAEKVLVKGADDEVEILNPLDPKTIAEADIVVLAGNEDSSKKALQMGARKLIDLNGNLENSPAAKIRAPQCESAVAGKASAGKAPAGRAIAVIAHPAAILLATFVKHLEKAGEAVRVVATVFHPASGFGKAALTELQQQTIALLSFQKLEKKIYDAQAAFAVLARPGAESALSLEASEAQAARHLEVLLGEAKVKPSLRFVQAPVFHGLTAQVWVEFAKAPNAHGLEAALGSEVVDVRGADVEAPDNVQIAGQDGVAVGRVEVDRANPKAAWFFLVADNHRLTAQNAMLVAREWTGA